jgi:hypothetical protein
MILNLKRPPERCLNIVDLLWSEFKDSVLPANHSDSSVKDVLVGVVDVAEGWEVVLTVLNKEGVVPVRGFGGRDASVDCTRETFDFTFSSCSTRLTFGCFVEDILGNTSRVLHHDFARNRTCLK